MNGYFPSKFIRILFFLLPIICFRDLVLAQQVVKDIKPGKEPSGINEVIKVYDLLYFNANDGEHGNEFWVSDGDEAFMIKEFNPGQIGSDPNNLFLYKGQIFISANENFSHLPSLYLCEQFDNFHAVSGFSKIRNHATTLWFNQFMGTWTGAHFFTADVPGKGHELMMMNELQRTAYLKGEAWPGPESSNPRNLTAFNDLLLFIADSAQGPGLYVAADNTSLYERIPQAIMPNTELIVYNNWVYFVGNDPNYGYELFKTQGDISSTSMVKDIVTGKSNSTPSGFFVFNNHLYFNALDENGILSTWKSSGSTAGTVKMQKIINTGFVYNNHLYFAAPDNNGSTALWKSDGTDNGTIKIYDINNLPFDKDHIRNFVIFKDSLFFTAKDNNHKYQLYKTNGTSEGTKLANPYGKINYNNAHHFINVNETLFFVASDYSHGEELFKWDGKPAPFTVPDPTNQIFLFEKDNNVIELEWWPAELAQGYIIQRSNDGINFETLDSTNIFNYVDAATAGENITYFYKIISYNTAGNSSNSEVVSGTTQGVLIPEAPYGMKISVPNLSSIKLEWKCDSKFIQGFIIQRSLDNINYFNIDTVAGNISTFTDSNVELRYRYYYRIIAYNSSGHSPYSPVKDAMIENCTDPTTPYSLKLTVKSYKTIEISWFHSMNQFVIERGTDGIHYSIIDTIDTHTYVDSSLIQETTYYYRVFGIDGTDYSCLSSVISGKTLKNNNTTGLSGFSDFNRIELYPIPVNNIMFIKGGNSEITSAEILSIEGRVLQIFHNYPINEINLENLSSGIYFIKFNTSNSAILKKIIKH